MANNSTQPISCQFPATGRHTTDQKRPLSARVELQHLDLLQRLLEGGNGNQSFSATIRAAWALTLRCYTGLNDVCFGFEEVGTSSDVVSAADLVTVLRMDENMSLDALVEQARDDQCTSPTEIGPKHQFNSALLMRYGAGASGKTSLPMRATGMSEKVCEAEVAQNRSSFSNHHSTTSAFW